MAACMKKKKLITSLCEAWALDMNDSMEISLYSIIYSLDIILLFVLDTSGCRGLDCKIHQMIELRPLYPSSRMNSVFSY